MLKRLAHGIAVLSALALATPALAQNAAQSYPSRPVKIIVPFGPGGPADLYARLVGQRLQEVFNQPFVVENRPGAGSVIGTAEAAKSPADGYTLLMMSNTQTANESLLRKKPYELMRDFVGVSPVNYSDLVIVVNPQVEARTLKDFIAYAKANPGKINYASSGQGTPYHMATELFRAMSGTDMIHIAHKNSGDARNNVIGGHVQMMMDAVTTMAPMVQTGKVIALATTGPTRSTVLPNVPTAEEAGLPGYQASIWLGFMAPAGTPREIVDKLNGAMVKYLSNPDLKIDWGKTGAVPMIMTPTEFDDFLKADIAKWRGVVEKFNITAD